MQVIIRNVQQGDARTLAYIQTESWKAAFAGILDAETLDKSTNLDRATAMYQRLLDANKGNGYLLSVDGTPHCIAYWDAARDAALAGKAELICIHSLPGNWRKGYGSQMMNRVLLDIQKAGYAEVVLWVFRDNLRARAFYEANGFTLTEIAKPAYDTEEVLYAKQIGTGQNGSSEDAMDITRIDHYADNRFSQTVLNQHGAYLVDREPYEIEITGADSAVVRGKDPSVFQTLIEEFRFHAPHIVKFYDEGADLLMAYPLPKLLELSLDSIQPSQFFIDQEKLNAVRTFLEKAEDIVIQVIPYGNRYISLDGHTRLFFAVQNGFSTVKAVESETDDWVWPFVREAERRKILCPRDMILLPHEAYEIQWNQYCDAVFANKD